MPFLKMKHWPFGIIGFDSLKDSDSTNNTGVFFWGQYGDTVWIQSMQLDRTGPQNSGKIWVDIFGKYLKFIEKTKLLYILW